MDTKDISGYENEKVIKVQDFKLHNTIPVRCAILSDGWGMMLAWNGRHEDGKMGTSIVPSEGHAEVGQTLGEICSNPTNKMLGWVQEKNIPKMAMG